MIRPMLALTAALFFLPSPAPAQETVQLDAAEMNRAGVLVRPVLERPFGEQVPIVGEVVRSPGTTLTVKTPVSARVIEQYVAPGDRVRAGDPLMVIHSHEIHALQGDLLRTREEAAAGPLAPGSRRAALRTGRDQSHRAGAARPGGDGR